MRRLAFIAAAALSLSACETEPDRLPGIFSTTQLLGVPGSRQPEFGVTVLRITTGILPEYEAMNRVETGQEKVGFVCPGPAAIAQVTPLPVERGGAELVSARAACDPTVPAFYRWLGLD